MATRYFILRSNVDRPLVGVLVGRATRSGRVVGGALEELTVHTMDGTDADAGKLREDPRNHAVLDADIALSLIGPKSRRSADTSTFNTDGVQYLAPSLLAVGAHTSPFTGQGATVAVLDTGIDVSHPAFVRKMLVAKNFTNEGAENDVTDRDGHGTHCAGTVCGASVGDVRVGVAAGVTRLCIGKVIGAQGGTAETLINSILWAVLEQKANVVSMSLGFDLPGNAERLSRRGYSVAQASNAVLRQHSDLMTGISTLRAFLRSQSPNVVLVAASGNESERPDVVIDASLPSSQLMAVGAVGAVASGDKWAIASFSNGRAEVVAPGVDIVSAASGGGWAMMSGTSMAAPHVAGVAALWFEKARNEGRLGLPDSIVSSIKGSATCSELASFERTPWER